MEPLTLEQIIQALEQHPRMGAAEDSPEGSRYVQISTTALSDITRSLKAHQEAHAALEQQVAASEQASLAASRQAIVDKVLAADDWQSGDAEIDAEFRSDALALAMSAEDDEAAEAALAKAVSKQQKLLARAQNTPGIEANDLSGKASAERAKEIQKARRRAGLN